VVKLGGVNLDAGVGQHFREILGPACPQPTTGIGRRCPCAGGPTIRALRMAHEDHHLLGMRDRHKHAAMKLHQIVLPSFRLLAITWNGAGHEARPPRGVDR
jgi:hypothetical protein